LYGKKQSMKITWIAVIWMAWACLPLRGQGQPQTGTLDIEVVDLDHNRGQVGILLFDVAEGFPMDRSQALRQDLVLIEDGRVRYTFSDLPYGRYAVSVMHDENGNDQLDTNILGIPKEGYGVSNNAKGTFGPPSFDKAAFAVDRPQQTIQIRMDY
jgi:uncharacterized protein (DUF2141 family)